MVICVGVEYYSYQKKKLKIRFFRDRKELLKVFKLGNVRS